MGGELVEIAQLRWRQMREKADVQAGVVLRVRSAWKAAALRISIERHQ
jgi:hypothetical protein